MTIASKGGNSNAAARELGDASRLHQLPASIIQLEVQDPNGDLQSIEGGAGGGAPEAEETIEGEC